MSRARSAFSSPESSPPVSPNTKIDNADNSSTLQGLAASVKLLLKLIEDHNEACTKDYDGRKMQRVASMITIVDEVKSRIQKSQAFVKRREISLRRCNTELRAHQHNPHLPKDPKKLLPHHHEPSLSCPSSPTDEKEILRMELSASLAARKSLEKMFSSLGKEKEIMASELARKVHELNGIEEHLNDLKAQNKLLLAKVQTCAAEHKCMNQSDLGLGTSSADQEDNVALEERNKALSAHLLKSLGGYRLLKRRLKNAQEEKEGIIEKMLEMDEQAKIGLYRIAELRKRISENEEQRTLVLGLDEELSALEDVFRGFEKFMFVKDRQDRAITSHDQLYD
ncbi:hypothetical protein MKW94_011128 [Papaver nudicaule]|uniref:Uncharacterized protein n=1 Tax=Papaver nudicaule TaxID=74823 RepID=A0AA41VRZ8_PAPNU|nr:hypothetical protein [Papaver nudicaule]